VNLEDGPDSLSQHVGKYHCTLSNITEERRPHLYGGESLKSHKKLLGLASDRQIHICPFVCY